MFIVKIYHERFSSFFGRGQPKLKTIWYICDMLIDSQWQNKWTSMSAELWTWLLREGESALDNLHVHIGVPHSGDGSDRLDHMADHVDDGQVDDGPAESTLSLRTHKISEATVSHVN